MPRQQQFEFLPLPSPALLADTGFDAIILFNQPMSEKHQISNSLERCVALLKKGDASSLKQLRCLLEKTQAELAQEVGVSQEALEAWEAGEQQPSGIQLARWKIKLASYIDEKIAAVLSTQNSEVSSSFWSLIWELVD